MSHTRGHLFDEITAWNLAVGLGLLWTALRPAATAGMPPVVRPFLAVLVHFGNRGPSGRAPLGHNDSGDTTGNAATAPEPAERPCGRRRVRLRLAGKYRTT